jgi:hypothetical protein
MTEAELTAIIIAEFEKQQIDSDNYLYFSHMEGESIATIDGEFDLSGVARAIIKAWKPTKEE